eukprot:CAMPEP_0177223652 /NCGR_PEP_ID=MMETSP0367-20130122/38594_1 /TAXON_ID=447022 ORGANISM="Scrippsiella hangoei-like, Strain SHHI-4" /NCGR_SAMPLE_ID=MMETSP0367 /ASSEMBLY_ACC=CAM_ASM_000362 /LENGTH=124 /DNA_ID=CAMNT_0018673627 /DNA_START=398 /DNA_END=773 /DNA_ORIENTATION=+
MGRQQHQRSVPVCQVLSADRDAAVDHGLALPERYFSAVERNVHGAMQAVAEMSQVPPFCDPDVLPREHGNANLAPPTYPLMRIWELLEDPINRCIVIVRKSQLDHFNRPAHRQVTVDFLKKVGR